ncbi:hypothetical protein PRIPAC_89078 [Pristionchus pacificus]|uniref:Uncharacterized protein n=1 Tax=Pristionchus pacificus TaxID=54126 RepID=A0A2A6CWM4_PRIPA|nr:hypothetical protein PRIPAC_89078 [Pristionchus pacificus]|eukprot:PDM82421.1 hypothetical protein PRIPAC_36814 [Pristionchus pacificus]
MPLLLLFAVAVLSLVSAPADVTIYPVIPADGESGPKVYGIDLKDCTDAMCWTGVLAFLDSSDHVRCRNAIYVRRRTSYSIDIEIMWEATETSISLRALKRNGQIDPEDIFVCSSDKKSKSVATTKSNIFHLYQRATPANLRASDNNPLTYCKFELQTREKMGAYMIRKGLKSLCAFVKIGGKQSMQKCGVVYFVFFVGYLLVLGIIALPMYQAWSDGHVDFRAMRAFFRFRRTLLELPYEEIRAHYAKRPAVERVDSIEHLH